MSGFGRVLEAAGWGVIESGETYGTPSETQDYRFESSSEGSKCDLWRVREDGYESLIAECKDEHHVLRIVAAIEGESGWRDMGEVPPRETDIELMAGHSAIILAYVNKHGVFCDQSAYPMDYDADSFKAWRPYNPANWEVGE